MDFSQQCMKFNPLRIAELAEDSECVLRRIEIGCRNHFIYTFWTYFPLAVSLQAFLSTRDRIILSLTNSVVCLDATEVAFALTERREGLVVDSWEVPTPRLAAWSAPSSAEHSEED